ncbi:hypothetical protein ACFXPW_20150 [Streptomyces goshikiensis]|uniref:hypothetical protein n=1 Tax=Streptomyces goshikiensis TaxID=1942 RepID=UPI00367DD2D0
MHGLTVLAALFYDHALAAADGERRLPLARMTGWDISPFEPEGLRVPPPRPPFLPDEPAAELGILSTHIVRHVQALPHISRAHVYRIGDGGAHLHIRFFARPEGQTQLYGSRLPVWDDRCRSIGGGRGGGRQPARPLLRRPQRANSAR